MASTLSRGDASRVGRKSTGSRRVRRCWTFFILGSDDILLASGMCFEMRLPGVILNRLMSKHAIRRPCSLSSRSAGLRISGIGIRGTPPEQDSAGRTGDAAERYVWDPGALPPPARVDGGRFRGAGSETRVDLVGTLRVESDSLGIRGTILIGGDFRLWPGSTAGPRDPVRPGGSSTAGDPVGVRTDYEGLETMIRGAGSGSPAHGVAVPERSARTIRGAR